jgi:hypothetical protein
MEGTKGHIPIALPRSLSIFGDVIKIRGAVREMDTSGYERVYWKLEKTRKMTAQPNEQ